MEPGVATTPPHLRVEEPAVGVQPEERERAEAEHAEPDAAPQAALDRVGLGRVGERHCPDSSTTSSPRRRKRRPKATAASIAITASEI